MIVSDQKEESICIQRVKESLYRHGISSWAGLFDIFDTNDKMIVNIIWHKITHSNLVCFQGTKIVLVFRNKIIV